MPRSLPCFVGMFIQLGEALMEIMLSKAIKVMWVIFKQGS